MWNFGPEKVCVLDGLCGRVDGAGADDDEETIILACEDPGSSEASGSDSGKRALGGDDLVAEESGLDEGIVLEGWEGIKGGDDGKEGEIRYGRGG